MFEGFNEFFHTEIDNIVVILHEKTSGLDNRYTESKFETDHRMYDFTPIFHIDVKEIICSAPAKSCDLDPIHTSLLKVHIGVLAPIIANIANGSFEAGIFSDELKDALLHPLPKHPSLELLFGNFRPVSNLSYLGKLIDRLAYKQLVHYTYSTGQMEDCQSVYQENFSIEMALLKEKTDTLDATDEKRSYVSGNTGLKCHIPHGQSSPTSEQAKVQIWSLQSGAVMVVKLSHKQNPMCLDPRCRWQYSRVLKKATFTENFTRLHSWAYLVQSVCGPTG